jgi:hypothetical protein
MRPSCSSPRPAQPSLPGFVDLQLVGDEVGEDPDSFGMTAGGLVVDTEREHQLDDRLHALGVGLPAAATGCQELRLELPRATCPARDRKTSRGLAWKQERDVEEGRQRQEAASSALEDDERQQSTASIAAMLGCSTQNVDSQLRKGRARLRDLLGESYNRDKD